MMNIWRCSLCAGRICGDGPAGFNSRFNGHGGSIVSVDPIYAFTARQIKERIDATFAIVLDKAAKNSARGGQK